MERALTFGPENIASYIGAMLDSGVRDSESIAILTAMRFYADEEGRVFRTVAEISAASRVSTRTTMDRLAQLVAMQIIERHTASKRGNVYQLLPFEMCASRTSDVRAPHIRTARAAHQKCEPRISDVREPHIRSAPAAHPNHIGVITCSDVNKVTTDEGAVAGATVAPAETIPTITDITSNDDEAAKKLQGHPAKDQLLPFARAALEIVGMCPEVYTLEAWLMRGFTLPRVVYGLRGARQAAVGVYAAPGKVILSAGRWMQNARPEEYREPAQAARSGPEAAQPISTPQLEARKPLTPEETAEMLKELGV